MNKYLLNKLKNVCALHASMIYHNSAVRLFLGRTIHTFDIYDIYAYLDILK